MRNLPKIAKEINYIYYCDYFKPDHHFFGNIKNSLCVCKA